MGIGMCAVVAEGHVTDALKTLNGLGLKSWHIGAIEAAPNTPSTPMEASVVLDGLPT
jgi:phosphoribosylaminoimidazole (AIR) synthetase